MRILRPGVLACLACALGVATSPAVAQSLGTAFTYQGRLLSGGPPASGAFDFEFAVFNAVTAGTQTGTTQTVNDLNVSAGLFTVALDFGPGIFTGARRWLEIRVRPGSSSGPFTTLPRQELSATPNALFSTAAPWSGITGVPAGFGDGVDNDSGGDITAVTAGTGLTGGGTTGGVTLDVNLAGSGAATTVARSDHTHFGQLWIGGVGSFPAFTVQNAFTGAFGFSDGIFGQSDASASARGVVGYATAGTGVNYGLWGQSDSTTGRAVFGLAAAGAGVNYGVYGQSNSPTGYAGYFQGRIGTDSSLDFGTGAGQRVNLSGASYAIGVQGGVVYMRTEPPGGGYAWFMGGSHSNAQNDPGPGGVRQMRLDGSGNLFVRGTVNPGGADFAEMLPAVGDLEPGDVLAFGRDGSLVKSSEAYQESVAGVFSTQPGFLGGAGEGEDRTGKVPLAVVGIVPVKASGENGPIRPGDRLVASATPGHAMRGGKEATVGTVIGKAITALESGAGVVRMLVVLQ